MCKLHTALVLLLRECSASEIKLHPNAIHQASHAVEFFSKGFHFVSVGFAIFVSVGGCEDDGDDGRARMCGLCVLEVGVNGISDCRTPS